MRTSQSFLHASQRDSWPSPTLSRFFLNISLLSIRFLTIPGADDSVAVLIYPFLLSSNPFLYSYETICVEWLQFRMFLTGSSFFLLEIFKNE
jgi:hypothetical protein